MQSGNILFQGHRWMQKGLGDQVHLTFVNVYEIIRVSAADIGIYAKLRCTRPIVKSDSRSSNLSIMLSFLEHS